MSDFNVNFILANDNKISGNFVLSVEEEDLIANFLLDESDTLSGLFNLDSVVEPISATFIHGTCPNIAAIFKIDYYPMKTSELTNDSNFVSDADYVHTDNNFTDNFLSNLNNQSGINTGDETQNTILNKIGYTPENQANKENITLDNSSTKYPTNNLVKSKLDLKAELNGSLSQDFNANNLTVATSINGYSLANLVSGLKEVSYTGNVDGSNKVFTTDNAYDFLLVCLNGIFYNTNFYTYSGNTLTWTTAPSGTMKLYANKGIFGLNDANLLYLESDNILVQQLSGSMSQKYNLASNAYGNSIIAMNSSTSIDLYIFCWSSLVTHVNGNSSSGQNILNVLTSDNVVIGQNILISGNSSTSIARAEINTIIDKGNGTITLKDNLIYTHTSEQYDYVGVGTILKVLPSSTLTINNLSTFTTLTILASDNYEVLIYGNAS